MMKKSIKFGLVSLLVGFVGFIGFGYCYNVQKFNTWADTTVNSNKTSSFETGSCFAYIDPTNCADYGKFYNTSNTLVYETSKNDGGSSLFCFDFAGYYKNTRSAGCQVKIRESVLQECQECAEVDTGAILSGYCDINYCVENGLCPIFSGSRSELKINDIVHQSAPFINITIPYEYTWDYTVDENEFDLVVSGYNVDYEYIDGIIRTQQSKPNQTDFNNIVSGLIPLLIPGLVIILFLYFVFKFIKKIF